MIEQEIDYNNLSPARKDKAQIIKIIIHNHPDTKDGTGDHIIFMLKAQYDAFVS